VGRDIDKKKQQQQRGNLTFEVTEIEFPGPYGCEFEERGAPENTVNEDTDARKE